MAKVVIPEAVKTKLGAVMEPLSKLEARIKEMVDKLPQVSQLRPDQFKKYLDELLKRVKEAQANVEKAFAEGLQWMLSFLNLPSKAEFDALKNKVAKIEKDLASLKGAKKGGARTTKKGEENQ